MSFNELMFGIETDDVVGLTEAQRCSIEFLMTFSVVDESTWLYKNYKYPRYRNFYGYAQIMCGAYVVKDVELIHINQEVLYFFQDSTDILQSVGCGIKKVLANLTPPVESQVTLYLLRQRYTSVRFRLCPGVKASVALGWHYPERLCDEIVVAPSDKQGNPQPADNKNPSPGPRPPEQGGDPKDRSNNDGKDDPNDDKPVEPKPGTLQTVPGQWFAVYSGYSADCSAFSGRRYPFPGATNGRIVPVVNRSPQASCGDNSCFAVSVTYNGAAVDSGGGVNSYEVVFVPA